MFISDAGIELIRKLEGLVLRLYKCQAGYKTIGYGHKLAQGEHYESITLGEADNLLEKDLYRICTGINRLTNVQLLQNQYDAIASFVFNLGLGAYQRSTLRSKINREEHDLVPNEIRRWIYIGTKKSIGLIKRRDIEAETYTTGY